MAKGGTEGAQDPKKVKKNANGTEKTEETKNATSQEQSISDSTSNSINIRHRRDTRNVALGEAKKALFRQVDMFLHTDQSKKMSQLTDFYSTVKTRFESEFAVVDKAMFEKTAAKPQTPQSESKQDKKEQAKAARAAVQALPLDKKLDKVTEDVEKALKRFRNMKTKSSKGQNTVQEDKWKSLKNQLVLALKQLPLSVPSEDYLKVHQNQTVAKGYQVLVLLWQTHLKDKSNRVNLVSSATTWLREYAPYSYDKEKSTSVTSFAGTLFELFQSRFERALGKDLVKIELRKNNPQWLARVRQAKARAENALFMEAYANGNIHTGQDLYSLRFNQLASREQDAANLFPDLFPKWKLEDPDKREAKSAEQKEDLQWTFQNPLDAVHIDSMDCCLKLRGPKSIPAGGVVFSEPPIAFKQSNSPFPPCGFCFREKSSLKNKLDVVPCSACNSAWFCTKNCLDAAKSKDANGRHGTQLCSQADDAHRLGKNSVLIQQMISWTEGMDNFKLVFRATNDPTVCSLYEVLKNGASGNLKWPVMAIRLLLAKYESKLNNPEADLHAGLVIEAHQLLKTLKKMKCVNDEDNDLTLLYKMLYFLQKYPLAKTKIVKMNTLRGFDQKQPVELGFMLSAFGGLVRMSCTSNVKRRFNVATGEVEFVATKRIMPGDILTTDWGKMNSKRGGRVQDAAWRKQQIWNRFGELCGCTQCAKVQVVQEPTANRQDRRPKAKNPEAALKSHFYDGFLEVSGQFFHFMSLKGEYLGKFDSANNFFLEVGNNNLVRKGYCRQDGARYFFFKFPEKRGKPHVYEGYFEGINFFRQRKFKPMPPQGRN